MACRLSMILLVIGMLPLTEAQPQSGNVPVGVVAKAGDTFISEKEFLERFEMLPGLQRRREGRMEETKLELLYSLIAEKLMAQEARERQLHLDSIFRLSFEEVRKMLARDQLYREEVSGKVRVGPKELEQALAQVVKEILISFIYCDRQADAVFIRKQIKTSRDFDSIQIDTSLHAVRDTATVIWSDANPVIERAAYSIKKGEVSSVIRAGTGYYILKVMRVKESDFYASLQPSVLRERVQEKIRERKEEARLSDFIASVLKNKVGYSRPIQLKALASALRKVFAAGRVEGKVALTENSVAEVRRECRPMLGDTLSVAGDIVWTVGDIVDRLYTKGFSVDSTTVKSIHHLVNAQLRVWVQQELLAQEALARGLDKYPAVRQQLDMWYDNFLAQSMRFYLKNQVRVTDAEVLSFMQSQDTAFAIPRVQIRELKTATLDEMHQALNELQSGKRMEEVIARWCSDPRLRERKGISDPFPISERYPIGDLAWQMLVGQQYGPIKDASGFLYFELLSKERRSEQSYTGYAGKNEKATKELLRQKEKRLVNVFLAQAGEARSYMVYQERLSRIKVSPIPMMTFRIVGFGGRMFAVPFVDRQIDWLTIETPTGKIVF